MSIVKGWNYKKSSNEINKLLGKKINQGFDLMLSVLILGLLTKGYRKNKCYTQMTHRDISNKIYEMFKDDKWVIDLKGYLKEFDLLVYAELYKLKNLNIIKFNHTNVRDHYTIQATNNSDLMLLCFIQEMKRIGINFRNTFRYSVSKIDDDVRVEIDVINNKGKLNHYYE